MTTPSTDTDKFMIGSSFEDLVGFMRERFPDDHQRSARYVQDVLRVAVEAGRLAGMTIEYEPKTIEEE
jgi:hypothetical protein